MMQPGLAGDSILATPTKVDLGTYQKSEQERETIAALTKLLHHAQHAKEQHAIMWNMLDQYIRGNHLLYRNRTTGEIVRMDTEQSDRLRSTNNQMRVARRQLHAKLLRQIADFDASPQTGDQDQLQGALAATGFIRFLRDKECFDKLYNKLMSDISGGKGNSCVELLWDPCAGRKQYACDYCDYVQDKGEEGEMCPACLTMMEIGQQDAVGVLRLIYEGDVRICYRDPRYVHPEPGVTDPENLRYCFVEHTLPLSTIRSKWPEKGYYVKATPGLYNSSTLRTLSTRRTAEAEREEYHDHATVYAYYQIPDSGYPQGRLIYFTEQCILDDVVTPWFADFGRLPLYFQYWERENDTFWAYSWAEWAWHRQRELNENETQQRENAELLTRAKIINPNNSGVGERELTDRVGQVVTVNAMGAPPTVLRMPELPQDVYVRGGRLSEDIKMFASLSPLEAGFNAKGASGRSLAIITAEADQQIGPIVQQNNLELAEMFKHAVMLARKYYSPEKQIRIRGEDGLQIYTLKDLLLADSVDIRVEVGDGFSKNQPLRIQQGVDLYQLGFYSDEMGVFDKARFAKDMRIKASGIGPDSVNSEYVAANAMVSRAEQGDFGWQPTFVDDPLIFAQIAMHWLRTKGRQPVWLGSQTYQYINYMYLFYVQMAQAAQGQVPPPDFAPPVEQAQSPAAGRSGSMPAAPGDGPGGNVRQDAAEYSTAADNFAEQNARVQTQREN